MSAYKIEDKKQILKWYIRNKLSFDSIGKAFKDHENLKDNITVKELENIVKYEKYAHVSSCNTCVHGEKDNYKETRCIDECIPNNYKYWSFPYGYWNRWKQHNEKFFA